MKKAKFNPELIVFDLDGTLVEFHHDFLFSETLRIAPRLGVEMIEREHLDDCFRSFDFFRFVHKSFREKFMEQFWEEFDWDKFPKPQPLEGARDALQHLVQGGVTVALATARLTPVDKLRSELEGTGFLPYFSHIISRPHDEIHWTDKRSILTETCNNLDIDPKKAVMVGDIPPDIDSAKDVGFGFTVAVRSGGMREAVLKAVNSDEIINDVRDLAALFC